MRVLSVTWLLLAVWFFTPAQPAFFVQQVTANQAKGGSISGTIAGPELNSAAGIGVSASLQEPNPGFQTPTFTTMSDDKGHFELSSLPAGNYQLEVFPKDKWLFKQTSMPVIVRDDQRTTVDVRFRFIDRCEGKSGEELTSADKAAIVNLMLDEAVIQKKTPNRSSLVTNQKSILSTKNIDVDRISKPAGLELLLLSPAQIQDRANHQGDFMYLEFDKIEMRGACVSVSLFTLWADGTSTVWNPPTKNLGESAVYYVFNKRNGTWTGEFVTGWIA